MSSLLSWRVSHTKETEVLFLPISNQNCDFGRNCSSVVEPLHQGYESKPEGGGLEGGEVLPYMAGGLLNMAYTGTCRWTKYGFWSSSPEQGIFCDILLE